MATPDVALGPALYGLLHTALRAGRAGNYESVDELLCLALERLGDVLFHEPARHPPLPQLGGERRGVASDEVPEA